MIKRLKTILAIVCSALFTTISAINLDRDVDIDGKYVHSVKNPIIWADVPDPDVIRVGDDYYMVTTTMHMMPGCPLMHSQDLATWKTVGYVFDTIAPHSGYRLEGGTAYSKGQWAATIREHKGVFYVVFSNDDAPRHTRVYTASSPEGPWELHAKLPYIHDSSILFDDDGKVYVVSGSGEIHLRELESDLSGFKREGVDRIIIRTDSLTAGLHEGSRILKHEGYYYIFIINWPHGQGRRQLCYRSKNVTGPYEWRVVINDRFEGWPGVAQGTIVDSSTGEWYGIFFQDHDAVGRILTLSPCLWEEGWPVIGDGKGHILKNVKISGKSHGVTELTKSDSFADSILGLHWQWNHCPVDTAWSLSERPGYLRLHASRVVGNLFEAPNTVTQRMEGPGCSGEIRLDLTGIKDGDIAGFGAFNGHSTLLSVKQESGRKYLLKHNTVVSFSGKNREVSNVKDEEEERVSLLQDEIYLRINADFRLGKDIARCSYSLDGENWLPIGMDYKMKYDYRLLFMGQRFAIYYYAMETPGGYIDVDYFKYNREDQ